MERKTTLRNLSFREGDKWLWRGDITEPAYPCKRQGDSEP